MTVLPSESPALTEPPATAPVRLSVSREDCPSPHSLKNKLGRVAWGVVYWLLFRISPKPLWGWRRLLLRLFGARVGTSARVEPSVLIWAPWNLSLGDESSVAAGAEVYCVGEISIGAHATVSRGALLCAATHDIRDPHMSLIVAPICVGDQAWVCARAFVGPGVDIGEGAVLGACAVAVRDVEPWAIVVGNPGQEIGRRVFCEDGENDE